jgi:hypothetical protein
MDLRELGRGGMDWIHLAQGTDPWWALVDTVMNLCVKCWEILELLSDWRLVNKDLTPWS